MNTADTSCKSPCLIHFGAKAYSLLVIALSLLQGPFLLAIRLYWGWQFKGTGWGKLTDLEKVTAFFTSLNIPFPHLNAIMAGSTECFGGILLMIGLASRPAAMALTFTMLVAYFTADYPALTSFFSDFDTFAQATPYSFLFASLIIMIFGPGWISLDKLIGYFYSKTKPGEEPSAQV